MKVADKTSGSRSRFSRRWSLIRSAVNSNSYENTLGLKRGDASIKKRQAESSKSLLQVSFFRFFLC